MVRPSSGRAVSVQKEPAPNGLDDGVSYALRSVVHRRMAGLPVEIPDAIVAEARRVADTLSPPYLDADRVAIWLAGIAAGVNDAPAPEAVMARAHALILACQEIAEDDPNDGPAIGPWCFTDDSMIAALRQFDRWQPVASLYRFVVGRAELWSRFRRELYRIVIEADLVGREAAIRPEMIDHQEDTTDDQQRAAIARSAAKMAPRLGNPGRHARHGQRGDKAGR